MPVPAGAFWLLAAAWAKSKSGALGHIISKTLVRLLWPWAGAARDLRVRSPYPAWTGPPTPPFARHTAALRHPPPGCPYPGYEGLLDDLQFYSGVLAATNIAFLYHNPGETIPNSSSNPPPALTLGQALNATNRTFSTGGDGDWFAQTAVTHDGVAAAQSGAIGDSSETWLETEVIGPGTLSFWWKVSCAPGADSLQLWVDGTFEAEITGEQDWSPFSLDLPAGQHFLHWSYVKDTSSASGADAGWVDQVQFAQPTTASLNLEIVRESDDGDGERFLLFPQLGSVTPDAITQHLVQSPHACFQGAVNGPWGSSSQWMSTLDSLIEECTNGVWTFFINKDDPSEQRYTFTVSIRGLDTNLLGPVIIHAPARDSQNVPPHPPFHWSGPAPFPTLYAYVWSLEGGASATANLPGTATNWPAAPALSAGTNLFQLSYVLWDATNVSFTMPWDAALNPMTTWNATASLRSSGRSKFAVGLVSGGVLLSPQLTEGGLRFGFQTQTGHAHALEARTNLTVGTWQPVTNFPGDGSVWQFTFPVTNSPWWFFRARTD